MPNTIADNLQRLKASRTAIGNAIVAKGGTVTAGDGFEEFPDDIATIPDAGNTATKTDTTGSGIKFIGDGNPLIRCDLEGNMNQQGTPSPSSIIMPTETGDKTVNLFPLDENKLHIGRIENDGTIDYQVGTITVGTDSVTYQSTQTWRGFYTDFIQVNENELLTFSPNNSAAMSWSCSCYDENDSFLGKASAQSTASTRTFTLFAGTKKVRMSVTSSDTTYTISQPMLTEGSTTPSTYIPYGYYLPTECGGTTTPVYLGQVQSTRIIGKYVFTGNESWSLSGSGYFYSTNAFSNYNHKLVSKISTKWSHYIAGTNNSNGQHLPNGYACLYCHATSAIASEVYIRDETYSTAEDFKTYLTQQYANGTPVTVWYVLATETTGVVNEPIRKIGDYADSISVTGIPTVAGLNEFQVTTTLPPSKSTIEYHYIENVPALDSKTITTNGTYNAADDNLDGYSSVVANVPNTYVAGDEGKVVSNGALVAQTAMSGAITVNDTYDTTLYNSITVNVTEPTPARTELVRFMDYDGTILHTYTADEFLALSAMPANPTHEGLTSQGWNWSFEDAVAYVTANRNLDVGQMYVTDDGKTRVYITLDNPDFLSPTVALYLDKSSAVDVDWGDGYQSQITSTSTSGGKKIDTHTYATTGNYVITLDVTAGTAKIQGSTSSGSYLLTDNKSNTKESSDIIYANSITKIELGSTISIGDGAFKALRNLQGITMPTTAAILVANMFNECYSLEGIVIPKNQTFVISSTTAANEFQDCFNLKNVSLSKESSVPGGMFRQCTSLERIVLPLGSTRIGIGSSAYQGSAFESCYKLSDVTIPEGIKYISTYAFKDCDLLEHIKFPSTLLKLENSCFSGCNLVGDLEIPASVTEISGSAFSQCRNLNSVKFNNGNDPLIIRGSAFADCSSLDSVKLPSNLTTIEGSAFVSCFSLTSIDIPDNVTSLGSEVFRNCYSLQSVKIGSGVTAIPNGFCRTCTGLTSIDIPSNVKSIGEYAFYECKSMKTITLHSGLETISGGYAFANMYSLERLIFPDTLASITGGSSFSNDVSLTELVLPETLTTMHPGSLVYRCYSLTSLSLPTTVTTLSSTSANMCFMTKLKEFEIPSYFTELGTNMFPQTISRLVIPTTVTIIQGSTFSGAYCLKQLRFISTTPPTCSSSSGFGLASGCDIYVPAYALPAYSTASRYPNPSSYNYIGYGTYESGETLPNETSDPTLGLTWYATLADWAAETNPITEGNGNEVYARTVAL